MEYDRRERNGSSGTSRFRSGWYSEVFLKKYDRNYKACSSFYCCSLDAPGLALLLMVFASRGAHFQAILK
jgi:hypothetical protein